jgi:hypothetical protein
VTDEERPLPDDGPETPDPDDGPDPRDDEDPDSEESDPHSYLFPETTDEDPFADFAEEVGTSFEVLSKGPDGGLSLLSENPRRPILDLASEYLRSGRAPEVVCAHIPILLVCAATKVATQQNERHPVYFGGPGIPYRFISHLMLIGPSGCGKGLTVTQFRHIVATGTDFDPTPIWEVEDHKGGSVESLRGGHVIRGKEREYVRGTIQSLDDGFIHIPEFTQLANKRKTETGAVQELIGGMDTGDYGFKTLMGGEPVKFHSEAAFLVGLQPGLLDTVEALVIGWNRRVIYDKYPPRRISDMDPTERDHVSAGDQTTLNELRLALRRLKTHWKPTSFDWSEVDQWLDAAYKSFLTTEADEQLVRSLALGYHMVTTYEWEGVVKIRVPPAVERIVRRCVRFKMLSRQSPARRGAHDAIEVLKDPAILGTKDKGLKLTDAIRIVALQLSVSEDHVKDYFEVLFQPSPGTGSMVLERYQERSSLGTPVDWVRITPAVLENLHRLGRESV